jgi:Na+/H+ antiporter NhaD/arsenite permease-like protein
MAWQPAAAATVFAATFAALALGRIGRRNVPRGLAALAGGLLTAALLRVDWRVIDFQVIALLAGLMVLAALAETAGLFAGLRRRLVQLHPALALWASLVLMAVASAVLLNDAAVVVLVPFLIPAFAALGLPAVQSVVLLAVAANVGSLATPFGNPQNAVLASAADLTVLDFLRVQGPLALAGVGLLGVASCWVARHTSPRADQEVPHAVPRGRGWVLAGLAAFLALAMGGRAWGVGLGVAALAGAALAYVGLRATMGGEADRAARRGLDWNVVALFVGLYLLMGGLRLWFPEGRVPTASLDSALEAMLATTLLSNVVGNVPAVLTFLALDSAWTVEHAAFLVAVSTLGGALLLTGSAASLLAADQARKSGIEVAFLPFLRTALPWVLPILLLATYITW